MPDDSSASGLRGRDLIGLGGVLTAAVVAGLVLGLLADDALGSSPAGVLVGIGLGILLGCTYFVLRVRRALRD